MQISNYDELLAAAAQQPEPQRFLFVFAKKELPEDHAAAEAQRFQAGLGGALTPIMCVDKPQTELTTFSDLVTESEKTGNPWDVVLIACLSGRGGVMPSASDADQALKTMIESVRTGGNLARFVAFDRDGDPIRFY